MERVLIVAQSDIPVCMGVGWWMGCWVNGRFWGGGCPRRIGNGSGEKTWTRNNLKVVLHGNSITMQESSLRMFKDITTNT